MGFSPSAEAAPHAYVAGMAAALAGLNRKSNLHAHKEAQEFSQLPTIKRLGEILHEHYSTPARLIFQRKDNLSDLEKFLSFSEKRENSQKLQSEIMDAVRGLREQDVQARPISRASSALESGGHFLSKSFLSRMTK